MGGPLPRKYILVSLCKNEGENIPHLITSVVEQTIRPEFWIIVDDGSTDNTPNIIHEAVKKYGWIRTLQLGVGKRDRGLHLANVMKKGFDSAISFCKENQIEYYYLGNLDGDLTIPPNFFENLMVEFENNLLLGIISGGTKHIIGDRVILAKISVNDPSGGHMLIRRECFEDIDGIPPSYPTDSVMRAMARINKWKTRRFEENIATEIRDVNAAEGYWKGFTHKGESSYYLYLNPLHVLVRVLIYSFRKPYYIGIAYFVGYLTSFVRKNERINDPLLKKYYRNKWKEHL